jgi:hypothetical protein
VQRTPFYKLETIHSQVDSAFIGKTRARATTARRLGASDPDAERYIRSLVRSLNPDEFCERCILDDGARSDVYCKINEDARWYVKIYIDDDGMVIISCHPLEKPIFTATGTRIDP